ncbi:MAG: hypothetical protein AB1449_10965 [Chloroflexota bacterium]
MHKTHIVGLAWSLALALPCAALAVVLCAVLTDALPVLARTWLSRLPVDWGPVIAEGAARWPELAGMALGQLLILVLLVLQRRGASGEPAY